MESSRKKAVVSRGENVSKGELLVLVQRVVLYITIILLLSLFIPAPWGVTEYTKGLLIISSALILVGIELIKIVTGRRVAFYKSFFDLGAVLIIGSFLVSTVASRDIGTSLWGFDNRLGMGLVAVASIYAITMVARGLISNMEEMSKLIRVMVWGIALSALLAILGSIGTDVWASLFALESVYPLGYSVLGLPLHAMVVWIIGLMLVLFLVALGNEKKLVFAHVLSVVTIIIALLLFTMSQGLLVVVLLLAALLGVATASALSSGGKKSSVTTWAVLLIVIISGVLVMSRLKGVRETVDPYVTLTQQVVLDGEATWKIVVSNLSDSLRTGFLGMGVDTFGVYYNRYRPVVSNGVDLSTVTYTSGSTEFMTLIGNNGLLGGLVWAGLGALLVYLLTKSVQRNSIDEGKSLMLVLIDIINVLIFVLSLVVSFSSVIYFIFFMMLSMRSVLSGLMNPRESEMFVLHLDVLVEKIGQHKNTSTANGLVVVVILLMGWGLYNVGEKTVSLSHVLVAEDKIVQTALQGGDLSLEEQRVVAQEVLAEYSEAIRLDRGNTYLYRRAASLVMQYIDSLFLEVNASDDAQSAYNEVAEDIDLYVKNALELTEEATERAPALYSNWDMRAFVYTRLTQYGFTSYYPDAIEMLGNAGSLNPNNPAIYYNLALMYNAQEDYETGLTMVKEALIRRADLESIALAGQISARIGELDDAKSYFEAALQLLEQIGAQDSSAYTTVQESISKLEEAIASGSSDLLYEDVDSVVEEVDALPEDQQAAELPDDSSE